MNTKYIALILIILAFAACKKTSVTPNNPIAPVTPAVKMDTDVYVSGYITANNGKIVPVYWKNGIMTKLTDSSLNVTGGKILINGKDVYMTGEITSASDHGVAVYWKNGVMTQLNDGSYDAYASDIAVSGNDVYVLGGTEGDHTIPVYWKNGIQHILKNGSLDTYSTSIAVKGNDVYVVGDSKTTKNNGYAALWINDLYTPIADTIKYSSANDVIINGNDVYVGGNISSAQSAYWKNGVETVLQGAPAMTNMAISNNNIYVLATIGLTTSGYWENGTLNLINGTGTYEIDANAFAVQGSDVYIAGIETATSNQRYPVYWKNGHIVYLPTSKTSVGGLQNVVTDIAVVVYPAN